MNEERRWKERWKSLCTFHICALENSWNTIPQLLRASSPMVAQNTLRHRHTHAYSPEINERVLCRKWCRGKMLILLKITFSIFFHSDPFLCHCCRVREWEKERYRWKEAEMETMSRTFDSIALFSIIVVYLCVYTYVP